jgi:uncharacterized protein (TIGR00255 family)
VARVLRSMTGFGEARYTDERLSAVAEVRAVNNRHFKLVCRISDPFDAVEPEVERLVRQAVHRGTVQLALRVDRPRRPEDYQLNLVALRSYRDQLEALRAPGSPPIDPSALLALPGVVVERRGGDEDPHAEWSVLEPVVIEALARFQESREREGRAMAEALKSLGAALAEELAHVEARAPGVVAEYNQRLLERVQSLVRDRVAVEPKDLIREVAIFAERADVAEEITRLRAHIAQFGEILDGRDAAAGRALEFVVQEMGREINTIGSKANDVAIGRSVVAMKGTLEKIRELIQNVE